MDKTEEPPKAPTQKRYRWLRLGLLNVFVLILPFSLYYLHFYNSRTESEEVRKFRALKELGVALENSIENLEQVSSYVQRYRDEREARSLARARRQRDALARATRLYKENTEEMANATQDLRSPPAPPIAGSADTHPSRPVCAGLAASLNVALGLSNGSEDAPGLLPHLERLLAAGGDPVKADWPSEEDVGITQRALEEATERWSSVGIAVQRLMDESRPAVSASAACAGLEAQDVDDLIERLSTQLFLLERLRLPEVGDFFEAYRALRKSGSDDRDDVVALLDEYTAKVLKPNPAFAGARVRDCAAEPRPWCRGDARVMAAIHQGTLARRITRDRPPAAPAGAPGPAPAPAPAPEPADGAAEADGILLEFSMDALFGALSSRIAPEFDQIVLASERGDLIYTLSPRLHGLHRSAGHIAIDPFRYDFINFAHLRCMIAPRAPPRTAQGDGVSQAPCAGADQVPHLTAPHADTRVLPVGQGRFRAFLQPIPAAAQRIAGAPLPDVPGDVAAAADEHWYLIGVIKEKRFVADALAASLGVVTPAIILLVTALSLLPLFWLMLADRHARFTSGTVAWVLLGLLGLTGAVTLLVLQFAYGGNLQLQREQMLRTTSSVVRARVMQELGQRFETLVRTSQTFLAATGTRGAGGEDEGAVVDACRDVVDRLYPFEILLIIDERGTSRGVCTTRPYVGGRYELGARRYFRAPAEGAALPRGSLWPAAPPAPSSFFVERIESYVDGRRETVISVPLRAMGGDPATQVVGALVTRLDSLVRPVLPAHTDFAVFEDATGEVLYHSNDDRSLVEDFIGESEGDRDLVAAVQSRSGRFLSLNYRGSKVDAYVRAMPGLPWSIAVFENTDLDDELLFRSSIGAASLLVVLYLLVVIVALVLGLLVRVLSRGRQDPFRWITPSASAAPAQATAVGFLLSAVLAVLVVVCRAGALAPAGVTAASVPVAGADALALLLIAPLQSLVLVVLLSTWHGARAPVQATPSARPDSAPGPATSAMPTTGAQPATSTMPAPPAPTAAAAASTPLARPPEVWRLRGALIGLLSLSLLALERTTSGAWLACDLLLLIVWGAVWALLRAGLPGGRGVFQVSFALAILALGPLAALTAHLLIFQTYAQAWRNYAQAQVLRAVDMRRTWYDRQPEGQGGGRGAYAAARVYAEAWRGDGAVAAAPGGAVTGAAASRDGFSGQSGSTPQALLTRQLQQRVDPGAGAVPRARATPPWPSPRWCLGVYRYAYLKTSHQACAGGECPLPEPCSRVFQGPASSDGTTGQVSAKQDAAQRDPLNWWLSRVPTYSYVSGALSEALWPALDLRAGGNGAAGGEATALSGVRYVDDVPVRRYRPRLSRWDVTPGFEMRRSEHDGSAGQLPVLLALGVLGLAVGGASLAARRLLGTSLARDWIRPRQVSLATLAPSGQRLIFIGARKEEFDALVDRLRAQRAHASVVVVRPVGGELSVPDHGLTGRIVVIRELEALLSTPARRDAFRLLLQRCLTEADGVIVSSDIVPAYWLSQLEREDEAAGAASAAASAGRIALAEWSAMFGRFEVVRPSRAGPGLAEAHGSPPGGARSRAAAFYRWWSLSTMEERDVLLGLARGGLANPRNGAALYSLHLRGLLEADERVVLADPDFVDFLLHEVDHRPVDDWHRDRMR